MRTQFAIAISSYVAARDYYRGTVDGTVEERFITRKGSRQYAPNDDD